MKQYLGDGVYADFDGSYLILTTEDGVNIGNKIYMEPEVIAALLAYIERLRERKSA